MRILCNKFDTPALSFEILIVASAIYECQFCLEKWCGKIGKINKVRETILVRTHADVWILFYLSV